MELEGKKALVTGGGTGVGAVVALRLIKAGASVFITGRREGPLRKLADTHPNLNWATCDVTDKNQVESLFAANGPFDIVVANAGAAFAKPFRRTSLEDMHSMLAVNLVGVFSVWQAALESLGKDRWGRLIAIASTAGLKGYAYTSAYCAAKHGVVGMTKSLALELAKTPVTVNAVCPSYVETPLLDQAIDNIVTTTGRSREEAQNILKANSPQNRFIPAVEVAETVLWLCSEQSSTVTGQAIALSGGEI